MILRYWKLIGLNVRIVSKHLVLLICLQPLIIKFVIRVGKLFVHIYNNLCHFVMHFCSEMKKNII